MPGKDDDETPGGGVVVAVNREAKTGRSAIRREVDALDERVDRVDHWIGRVEDRVSELGDRIGEVREDHARMAGEVSHLVRAYEKAAEVSQAQAMTDLEVRKAGALAEITNKTEQLAHRRAIIRELAFKAIAVAMGIWAIISALIAAR